MRRIYGEKVFKTVIPAWTRVAESPRSGIGNEYARSSTGAKAYTELVKEVFDVVRQERKSVQRGWEGER